MYKFLFEESSNREIHIPPINHDYTVKIDGIVKISVNKINEIRNYIEKGKFSIKMFKQELIFLKKVTTLVPLYWTPKLYAIFSM